MTPFTILTGFLGAGKTTLLNRMLAASGGRRIAVLVNELGRISIDTRLIIARGSDVLELAGGCLCCKLDVKNDLWDGIADVVRRSRPDAVVLETTGIAEPPAIIDGLAKVDVVSLAGVVCVVDGEAGPRMLERRVEARVQLESADRVMLSKLDLAAPAAVEATHAAIAAINPDAERASFPDTDDGAHALTGWLLERRRARRRRAHPHAHAHGQVVAVTFSDDAPLSQPLVAALIDELRPSLLRAKGFVHLAGDARRGFLEIAGDRAGLSTGEPWRDGEPRRTELVLIGESLDETAIRRRLWACRAGA